MKGKELRANVRKKFEKARGKHQIFFILHALVSKYTDSESAKILSSSHNKNIQTVLTHLHRIDTLQKKTKEGQTTTNPVIPDSSFILSKFFSRKLIQQKLEHIPHRRLRLRINLCIMHRNHTHWNKRNATPIKIQFSLDEKSSTTHRSMKWKFIEILNQRKYQIRQTY